MYHGPTTNTSVGTHDNLASASRVCEAQRNAATLAFRSSNPVILSILTSTESPSIANACVAAIALSLTRPFNVATGLLTRLPILCAWLFSCFLVDHVPRETLLGSTVGTERWCLKDTHRSPFGKELRSLRVSEASNEVTSRSSAYATP